jgi:hypothetical protein
MERMKRTALVAILGLALMAFGCSDDDDSGTGGSAGSGGEGGTGGSAGAGGDGGAGGEGGEGGAGGEGGSSGGGDTIEAGSGQTIWRANTTPTGGGTAGDTGGCTVFVTALNTDIFVEVVVTLDVESDGNNNLSTAWELSAANYLLPTLGNAAELGGLSIAATVANAAIGGGSPGEIGSELAAAAEGELIGGFIDGGALVLATPDAITEGTGAAEPLDGTVNVNWDGSFVLDLELGGEPLVSVTDEACTFDEEGDGVDFAVN